MDTAGSARRRFGPAARPAGALLAGAVAALCWGTAAPGTAAATDSTTDSYLSPDTAAACSSVPSTADPAVTLAVYGVGREMAVSSTVMLAGFEAGWVESHMNNLHCGDRDSLGVFQQRPSQGWGTASQILDRRYASRQFFSRAVQEERACGSCTSGQLAQRVQRSAYGERDDQAATKARSLLRNAAPRYKGRYSVRDICGSGFRYIDGHELSGGTVYLLWDGTSNCVTTIKSAKIGTASYVKAYVNPEGSSYKSDSGSFSYYAGPATRRAPGCIRWGGAVGKDTYASPLEHCG